MSYERYECYGNCPGCRREMERLGITQDYQEDVQLPIPRGVGLIAGLRGFAPPRVCACGILYCPRVE